MGWCRACPLASAGRISDPCCMLSQHELRLICCLPRAAGGVFSLHECGGRVLTASKDGTVAVSALGDAASSTTFAVVLRYDELHEGVVKCARWRQAGSGGEPLVFASCGNDRQLCIVDARQTPSAGGQG